MAEAAGRLGIVAGSGDAPRRLIAQCARLGRPFFVICLQGQAAPDLGDGVPHVWLGLGAFWGLQKTIKAEGITDVVLIGGVRRPSLAELKLDWLGAKVAAQIGLAAMGDDGLLRALAAAIERECAVRVIGAHDVASDLLAGAGLLTRVAPDEADNEDIARGFAVARALGAADVGQAVVVQRGVVLRVEAAEGTAALIARAGLLKRAGGHGVLVKAAKPQQDDRLDLPAIGPETVAQVASAGLAGVAVEAERCLILDKDKVAAAADAHGLWVLAL